MVGPETTTPCLGRAVGLLVASHHPAHPSEGLQQRVGSQREGDANRSVYVIDYAGIAFCRFYADLGAMGSCWECRPGCAVLDRIGEVARFIERVSLDAGCLYQFDASIEG